MQADTKTSLRVGVVVAVAMTLLMAAIWTLGAQTKMFRPKVRFVTYFNNVAGIEIGSDVRLAGYRIGYVRDIRMPQDIDNKTVVVELSIERRSAERIRADTEGRLACSIRPRSSYRSGCLERAAGRGQSGYCGDGQSGEWRLGRF